MYPLNGTYASVHTYVEIYIFLNFEIFSWKASSFKQNKTNKKNYPFLYSPFLFRNLDLQRHMQYWKSILLTDHMPYALNSN